MKIEIEKMSDGWSITCSDGVWFEVIFRNGLATVLSNGGSVYSVRSDDAMGEILSELGLFDYA